MSYSDSEEKIYQLLLKDGVMQPSEIQKKSGFSKRQVSRLTSSLLFKKRIGSAGSTRNPNYYALVESKSEVKINGGNSINSN